MFLRRQVRNRQVDSTLRQARRNLRRRQVLIFDTVAHIHDLFMRECLRTAIGYGRRPLIGQVRALLATSNSPLLAGRTPAGRTLLGIWAMVMVIEWQSSWGTGRLRFAGRQE